MPEGPEAKTVVRGLNELVENRWITAVKPVGGRYLNKNIPGLLKEFIDSSHPVTRIWRHGKAIVFDLSTNNHIIVTLGMTGKFSLNREKHAAVEFVYGDAHEKRSFYFVDQRRFGTVRIVSADKLMSTLPKVGWDPLDDDIDVDRVSIALKSIKKPTVIASALLEPSVISGIGNYLRAEILYAVGMSPWKKCDELSEDQVKRLCEESQRISRRSYELGGNTIENFVDLSGGSGKFFNELKVYAKRTDPEGNEVLAEKSPEGRTIHWCPAKQS